MSSYLQTLAQIDWLVSILETPVFAFLRIHITRGRAALIRALYGLLAILPQSEAYRILAERLRAVPLHMPLWELHVAEPDPGLMPLRDRLLAELWREEGAGGAGWKAPGSEEGLGGKAT